MIALFVSKCSIGLGIELGKIESEILTEDLIEKYKHESIEDIQICLKRGRQGFFGTTYGKINMIVISEWMTKHLEEKAMAREQMQSKFKSDNSGPQFKTIQEYHDWVNQGLKNQKEIETIRLEAKKERDAGKIKSDMKELEYQEFRKRYIESKTKKPLSVTET